MDRTDNKELISALADGELRGEDVARALQAAASDPAARAAWQSYHLIGDVLRSPELARGTASGAFAARLQERLAGERIERPLPVAEVATVASARPAANDASVRWKWAAGFASVAAVAAVAWNVAGPLPAAQPQMAAAPVPAAVVLTGTGRGSMLRDPHLDQLLAAHRQLGGATALQAPAGFLRNATFEGPAR